MMVRFRLRDPLADEVLTVSASQATQPWIQHRIEGNEAFVTITMSDDWDPRQTSSLEFQFKSNHREFLPLPLMMLMSAERPEIVVSPESKTHVRKPHSEERTIVVHFRGDPAKQLEIELVHRLSESGEDLGEVAVSPSQRSHSDKILSID